SVAACYQSHMVPMIFEPYAQDMAARVALVSPQRVLEIAAGTGVLTRALARALPPSADIAATDLNPAMLDVASRAGTSRPVHWQPADAMALPFDDRSTDGMVCQFGVMFFPDKAGAFAEMRRVLRPGGVLLFNVWDRIEDNEFAHTAEQVLAAKFADNPPKFMSRTPHGYHDIDTITRDLQAGGFGAAPRVDTLAVRARAATPRVPAMAYCQGTPLRPEIEARGMTLGDATDFVADALERRFGPGPVEGKIQAHVVTVSA
ncbi:MAG: methyltransferase domain-containing protein, partial [Massilia sp.]